MRYNGHYQAFEDWYKPKIVNGINEDVLLAHLAEETKHNYVFNPLEYHRIRKNSGK